MNTVRSCIHSKPSFWSPHQWLHPVPWLIVIIVIAFGPGIYKSWKSTDNPLYKPDDQTPSPLSVAVCRVAVMKNTVLIFVPLCWLLCWTLPAGSNVIRRLNMVEDAVDDMYSGCNTKMAENVKDKYFINESKELFKDVWEKAEPCSRNKFQHKDTVDNALTQNHMQAICVYTSGYKMFYKTFNDVVRTNRTNYGTSFKYHSLHFWLTTAIQILREKQGCHITYRRTHEVHTGEVNQIIRFGYFASSSFIPNMTDFGQKTCFKILTCTGAFLKNYSDFEDEKEVLIPPYEKFKIIERIKDKSVEELKDCEEVYILESTGVHSNVNCHAVKYKKDQSFFIKWWSKLSI